MRERLESANSNKRKGLNWGTIVNISQRISKYYNGQLK